MANQDLANDVLKYLRDQGGFYHLCGPHGGTQGPDWARRAEKLFSKVTLRDWGQSDLRVIWIQAPELICADFSPAGDRPELLIIEGLLRAPNF